jgi:hypothetical protein
MSAVRIMAAGTITLTRSSIEPRQWSKSCAQRVGGDRDVGPDPTASAGLGTKKLANWGYAAVDVPIESAKICDGRDGK